jgi:PAS domain S-box-containing protein
MLNPIKRLLATPIFEGDEDKSRIASLLNILLLSLIFSVALTTVVTRFERLANGVLTLMIAAAVWVVMRRGQVRLASRMLVIGLSALLAYVVPATGGVRATTYGGLIVVVMLAGLLIGPAAAAAVAVFASLLGAVMLGAQAAGLWSAPPPAVSDLTYWIVFTVYFFVTAMVLTLSTRIADGALRRARAEFAERLAMERKLQDSERRFQTLIERSFVALVLINAEGVVTYATPAAQRIMGYTVSERTGRNAFELIAPETRAEVGAAFARLLQSQENPIEITIPLIRKDGARIWIEGIATNLLADSTVGAIVLNFRDITELKHAEGELASLYATAMSAVEATSLNPLVEQISHRIDEHITTDLLSIWLLGETDQTLHLVARHYHGDLPDWLPAPIPLGLGIVGAVAATGQAMRVPDVSQERLYRPAHAKTQSELCVPMRIGERVIGVINAESHALNAFGQADERWLVTVAGQLAIAVKRLRAEDSLQVGEERLRQAVNVASIGIFDHDQRTDSIYWSSRQREIHGLGADEPVGLQTFLDRIHPDDRDKILSTVQSAHDPAGDGVWDVEHRIVRRDGAVRWLAAKSQTFFAGEDGARQAVRTIGAVRDITEQKQVEEQIRKQVMRLEALRTIDIAIAASHDLNLTLGVLLEQVVSHLNVDAVCLLLLNARTHTLEYAVGRGFRTPALQTARLRPGNDYTGRAALEHRTMHIPDLRKSSGEFSRAPAIAGEDFVSYYCIPLIAKGEVKGMLEVFHRAPLEADGEWLNFFEILAGQAAIAIDAAQLLAGLQRSNLELSLAYDATIEGWSRAMDLRDKETEGHTQRVTDLTVRLAEAMGIPEEQIVHIRRGALLHDMGKLGVPDRILLKAGALNDEEWELMRRHPQYAFEMLASIAYLRPALDIPFCHHEKWDGSGYPRGLKGNDIPLAARLFAVVDVWDALLAGRPYRPPWTKAKVVEHIRAQAGIHFDPECAAFFLAQVNFAA